MDDKILAQLSYDPVTGIVTRNGIPQTRCRRKGYIRVCINKKMYTATHIIWKLVTGEFPDGEIDHINRVRDDNRWENLRLTDRSGNTHNTNLRKDNTSGLKGVHPDTKWDFRWRASIQINNKRVHLGSFTTLLDAAAARKSAENKSGLII